MAVRSPIHGEQTDEDPVATPSNFGCRILLSPRLARQVGQADLAGSVGPFQADGEAVRREDSGQATGHFGKGTG